MTQQSSEDFKHQQRMIELTAEMEFNEAVEALPPEARVAFLEGYRRGMEHVFKRYRGAMDHLQSIVRSKKAADP